MTEDDRPVPFEFEAEPAEGGSEPSPETEKDPVLEQAVLEALRTVYDPEIPVNLVELGLIYDLNVRRDGKVSIEMTLTTPACPVAGNLPGEVEQTVRAVEGVRDVAVELVWTPPWSPELMTDEAKLELGML
jgi:FeS assembly SUF system protein